MQEALLVVLEEIARFFCQLIATLRYALEFVWTSS